MKRAFTLIETMIVLAIICILLAISIPNIVERQKRQEAARTLIGQTISISGIKCLINDYADGKYKVIILGSPAIPIEMTKEAVDAAYAEYTKNHAEKP